MTGRHPVDHALHAAAVARRAVARLRIVGAVQLHDVSLGILDDLFALDEVGVAQTHLVARAQAVVFLGGDLHEVLAFDVDHLREGNTARSGLGILGVVDRLELLLASLFVVVDDYLQRVEHGHAALGHLVQVLAHAVLQFRDVDRIVALGYADHLGEGPHRGGGVTLAAQTADGRHAGVVPAHHDALLHQLEQFALRHEGIGEVQTGELVLVRGVDLQRLNEPVVERTVHVEFQRADRVGDLLDRVALAVRVVVHGIDAPLVARAVVLGVDDAVHDRVAEEHVGVGHVDLGAQHLLAVGELAVLHAPEQIEVLLHGAVAPGRLLTGLRNGAAALADLLLGLVVYVGQTLSDQDEGPFVELFEVVRSVALHGPVESQPPDVALDRVHVLDILLGGVRVVETQVALAAVFLCQAEVDADALGVADMQVAVRFGRETGLYARFAFGDGLLDDLLEEIDRLLSGRCFVCFDSHIFDFRWFVSVPGP